MLVVEHSVETEVVPEQIWELWRDVENWKSWDDQIEYSRVDGPFQAGSFGETKFISTPPMKTLLTDVVENELVVQEAYLPLARVVSFQSMQREREITRVTFRVEVRGFLAPLYALKIGKFVREKVPVEVEQMLALLQAV